MNDLLTFVLVMVSLTIIISFIIFLIEIDSWKRQYMNKRRMACADCAHRKGSNDDSPRIWTCYRCKTNHFNGITGEEYLTYEFCDFARGTKHCRWKALNETDRNNHGNCDSRTEK